MRDLALALKEGRISVAEWQIETAATIKQMHLASTAAARGGWAQLTPADLGRAGQIVKKQYGYLGDFARQIESGEQPLDGRFLRRVDLYAQAARGTFHTFDGLEQQARGKTEERNVLHASESCAGCIEQSGRSWVGIGELIPVGSRSCLVNCKCDIEYR